MENERFLKIEVLWDADNTTWTAKIDDVPCLEFEAASFDGLINGMKEAFPEITLLTKEKVIGFTGDSCVEGKRTNAVDSITGILEGKDTSKSLTKHDLRHMTDKELQRLTGKAVNELYNRQKAKCDKLLQEALNARDVNDQELYNELCARVGRAKITEGILKEFLGKF